MSEDGIVVIGAGVAGLSAAAALRRHGVKVTVIEAADRIGGRAHTTTPPLLGTAFDHGASWLHAAEHNPLAALAMRAGDRTIDTSAVRVERTRLPGRFATQPELDSYAAAEAAFEQQTRQALQGPDTSLAEAVAPIAGLPWLPAVVNWEAPIIAAADARALSLQDWRRNRLEGANLEVEGGLGAFVLRRLAPLAGPLRLNTAAMAIRWDGPGVTVQTMTGSIRAAGCIVTVSTGFLASGRLRFDPALPASHQEAIGGLPMGVLNKVTLRARGADRLGLPDSCGVDQAVSAIDAPTISLIAWPHGRDHVICFAGGSHSGALEQDGGLEPFARAQLRALFGARADDCFGPGAVTTAWASDPWALGAYAFARPGCADARGVLGTPLGDARLIFAGEATRTDGLAGTVGGAFLAGEAAARTMLNRHTNHPTRHHHRSDRDQTG